MDKGMNDGSHLHVFLGIPPQGYWESNPGPLEVASALKHETSSPISNTWFL